MPAYEYFYVYTPFTGTLQGQANYCGGGAHWIHPTGSANPWYYPRDVAVGSGTQIIFYPSTNVKSIHVFHDNVGCASPCNVSPYNNGVIVKFFKQYSCIDLIGEVYYGHGENRLAEGQYNLADRIALIGNVPADGCSGTCYDGSHSHMEAKGASWARTGTCGTWLTYGSSTLYRWQVLI